MYAGRSYRICFVGLAPAPLRTGLYVSSPARRPPCICATLTSRGDRTASASLALHRLLYVLVCTSRRRPVGRLASAPRSPRSLRGAIVPHLLRWPCTGSSTYWFVRLVAGPS